MTARDLIASMLRQWYVMAVGAALTVAALYVVVQQSPVYWTQYNIVLVSPADERESNVLDDPRYRLQPLAGVIATQFNDGHPPLLTGDVDATMVGQGRLDGVQIRVPNLGSQWLPIFSANYLDVQVAGDSARAVSTAADGATRDVAALLEARQDELEVPDELRARSVASSAEPTVYPVGGSRSRALAATALAGASITVMAGYWLDRWRQRRQPTKSISLPGEGT